MKSRILASRAETSCRGRTACLQARTVSLAAFRPAGIRQTGGRKALLIECKESRIGKQPVVVPAGVTVTIEPGFIKCKGGKGELLQSYNDTFVEIKETEEKGTYKVYKKLESRQANMSHGLVRSLFCNMVEGLSTGFTKTLTMIGVGYRAVLDGKQLTLNLGYSNPVVMPIPEGIEVQFAADIRAKRPPEPYKGKGVRYKEEYVPKKEGKRGKK